MTTAILQDDWAQLTEVGAAVHRNLDDALADLVRAAVEDPTASYAASCARIDRAFEDRMAPYQHLAWAMDQAAALQRKLKDGLRQGPYRTDGNDPKGAAS
ncbi:hypothetical protein [Methylobacterium sp. J-077]|uniref:hypothetical protein n=1 Tax=Methylobacterium sp. J-077 TaxID=2836656 RepID=UPI001FBB8CF9|nr:hypothetical protein [Methylobacterium sp. J-077]MCJ2124784.1 hypothetical protein [Methylobacterium sp. J-077]